MGWQRIQLPQHLVLLTSHRQQTFGLLILQLVMGGHWKKPEFGIMPAQKPRLKKEWLAGIVLLPLVWYCRLVMKMELLIKIIPVFQKLMMPEDTAMMVPLKTSP